MRHAIRKSREDQHRAVRALQWLTIGWLSVELCLSLLAGLRAHSIALTAFGADSGIELLSASIVLRRFYLGPSEEQKAARFAAWLLYLLGVYIVVSSVLSFLNPRFEAKPTLLGIAMLAAAAILMPLIGRLKRKYAVETGSQALKADATQSNVCAYMAWIALAGLVINAVWHLAWADSLAALLLIPIIYREANEARNGELCRDC